MVNQLFHTTLLMAVVVAVVVAVAQGMKCFSKADTQQQKNISKHYACKTPKDTAEYIRIPDGYNRVKPDFSTVKRCHHNVCGRTRKCVAVETFNRTVKVIAYRRNKFREVPYCTQVPLQDDTVCNCKCNDDGTSCNHNQVFSDTLCRCECLNHLHQECIDLMNQKPGMYMWNKKTCSCPCNKDEECGTGTVWRHAECRCVPVYDEENSISEETFWFPSERDA